MDKFEHERSTVLTEAIRIELQMMQQCYTHVEFPIG